MRKKNFEIELVKYANEINNSPFEWGVTDCATIVRKSIEIMLGEDIFDLPLWDSLKTARSIVRDLNILKLMGDVGGLPITLSYAHTGDIGLYPNLDDNGLPQFCVVLPRRKILISTIHKGVEITELYSLLENTTFWRYA